MNEKESGREHTGIAAEMKVLLRGPPLLIGILAVFLLFAVFIIYPFVKILLVPASADWMRAVTDKEFIEVFSHTIFSSFVATATAIVFGFIFAYGVNYTNMQAFLSGGGSASYHGAVRCQRSGIHHAFRPPRLYYMGNASFEGGSLRTCRALGSADYRFFPAGVHHYFGCLEKYQSEFGTGGTEPGGERVVPFPYGDPQTGDAGAGKRVPPGRYQLIGGLWQPHAGRR